MNFSKNLALWLLVGLLLIIFVNLFSDPRQQEINQPYSTFVDMVEQGVVRSVEIQGENIKYQVRNNNTLYKTVKPDDPQLIKKLRDNKVEISAKPEDEGNIFLSILISWFPMLLLIGVWIWFMRSAQMGGNKTLGFAKSRAKLLTEAIGRITFSDVAGVDEAKQELEEIVEFLRNPQKFQRLGGKIPKGCLLVGSPGSGKTLLARAVAGEANVPFFTISGSDFVEMFVGVGASRVRDMFEQGKANAPCIIFIDEIDAVGRHRGAGLGVGNDEREQTLNQLLVEMDGFEVHDGVILIAATNRPDVLDPALLRPGRFDRQVIVPNPDIRGREGILKVHMRKLSLAPNVDPYVIARGTPGFSGADLANLVNEAALLAARAGQHVVTQNDFENAKDKVMMGSERRSMVMTEEEKELIAYHEAGHAIVGLNVEGNDPLHKVTIIPRGRAMGLTMNLPERDRYGYKKSELKARLAMMFGGRVAEELIYGADYVTTGAGNDIQQATSLARAMVTEYGMSEKLGPLRFNENEEELFLGRAITRNQNISEETARQIDEEVRRFINEAKNKAKAILSKQIDELHLLAKALLEHETLSADQVNKVLAGEDLIEAKNEPITESKSSSKSATKSSVPISGKKAAPSKGLGPETA